MINARTLFCAAALVTATAAVTSAIAPRQDDEGSYSKPTSHHDVLDNLWGKWNYAVSIESDKGTASEITLEADYQWALGGRFLVGKYDGYIDGDLFQAREILGYDTFRGEYRSVWVDNNTTAFTLATGAYDARSRTLTFNGVQDDVENNRRDQPFRFVYRFVDNDHFRIEVWRPGPDGKLAMGTSVNATRLGAEDD